MKSVSERVIDKFGGMRPLARALGHANVSTVQGWKARGLIPIRQIPTVVEAGRVAGFELTAPDFVELGTAPDRPGDQETTEQST